MRNRLYIPHADFAIDEADGGWLWQFISELDTLACIEFDDPLRCDLCGTPRPHRLADLPDGGFYRCIVCVIEHGPRVAETPIASPPPDASSTGLPE